MMNISMIPLYVMSFGDLFQTFLLGIIAALIIGILAPLIGSVVVIKRLSFIADTLSHFSLAGICFGYLIGNLLAQTFLKDSISPVVIGIIFSVAGTFIIEKLRGFYKNYKELSMPIVMSLGAALTGIFIAYNSSQSSNITNVLLFGNFFVISTEDFLVILSMALVIGIFIAIYYKKIIAICFDESYSRISGINTKGLQLVITIIIAIFISLAMQMIGVLLISALMIVPVAASMLVGKSFKSTCIIAIIFSELSIICTILSALVFEKMPSGSFTVIVNIIILFTVMFIKWIIKIVKKRAKRYNKESMNDKQQTDIVIEDNNSIIIEPINNEKNN